MSKIIALTIQVGLIVAALSPDAEAKKCRWMVPPNISPPYEDQDSDSGSSGLSIWSWAYLLYANDVAIVGSMQAQCDFCSTSLSRAGSGNGTYTIQRIVACDLPREDIEAYGRHEFKARAHLDAHNAVRCMGLLKIHGGSCPLLLDQAKGGVALSSVALEKGKTSGTIKLKLGVVEISANWALSGGDDIEAIFSDVDQATGGKSICVFTCHTQLQADVNISDGNGVTDNGGVQLLDSKYELTIWGTCDGKCQTMTRLLHLMDGY